MRFIQSRQFPKILPSGTCDNRGTHGICACNRVSSSFDGRGDHVKCAVSISPEPNRDNPRIEGGTNADVRMQLEADEATAG